MLLNLSFWILKVQLTQPSWFQQHCRVVRSRFVAILPCQSEVCFAHHARRSLQVTSKLFVYLGSKRTRSHHLVFVALATTLVSLSMKATRPSPSPIQVSPWVEGSWAPFPWAYNPFEQQLQHSHLTHPRSVEFVFSIWQFLPTCFPSHRWFVCAKHCSPEQLIHSQPWVER